MNEEDEMGAAFDGERLREVMRDVASPVTVVTYLDSDGPRGVTIGSFTSVALDPPLVSFNVSRESSAHDVLTDAERLNINILSEDQAYVASHFALSGLSSAQQLEPVMFELDDGGLPVLTGSVSTLFCRRISDTPAGDSTVLVAEVQSATAPALRRPLLYFRQSYHGVGDDVAHAHVDVNRLSSSTP
jgi:3-hydroxy-9,10-secoandrosta-1,3,5(10)-triene-9,17-dione monooxygenase reductase component